MPTSFFEDDILDAKVGARFRDEILAVGGSRPAAESFKAFRGREPSADALLRHSGLDFNRRGRLATWNVNSLKVRLPHLLDWLAAVQPDVACLRKPRPRTATSRWPRSRPRATEAVFCGQKSYNGVAILARSALTDVQHGIPDFPDDPKRVIAATVGGVLDHQSLRAEWAGARLGQIRLQAPVVLRPDQMVTGGVETSLQY